MFKLDEYVTINDIKNPEFLNRLSSFIHKGIDYYILL